LLKWTGAGDGVRLTTLVLRAAAEGEYADGGRRRLPDTKAGTFSQSWGDDANRGGWTVIGSKVD
jgi:hypothetical protein